MCVCAVGSRFPSQKVCAHAYVCSTSPWFQVIKRYDTHVMVSGFAIKFVGLIAILILTVPVIVSFKSLVQFFCFGLFLGVIIAYLTELYIYFNHYLIRRSNPRFIVRSFKRLGFLTKLSYSSICLLYKVLFFLIGASLLALHLVLLCVQYFHTAWLFNKNVALQMMPTA